MERFRIIRARVYIFSMLCFFHIKQRFFGTEPYTTLPQAVSETAATLLAGHDTGETNRGYIRMRLTMGGVADLLGMSFGLFRFLHNSRGSLLVHESLPHSSHQPGYHY